MIRFLTISLSIYILDIITKMVIRSQLYLGQEISVLPFFNIVHIQNTGIAFGLLQGQNLILLILGLFLLTGLFWMGHQALKESVRMGLSFAVVIGGAMGNITDRVIQGRVTDFLDFFIGPYHWPAFNVADSAICVGAGLLIYFHIKDSKNVSNSV